MSCIDRKLKTLLKNPSKQRRQRKSGKQENEEPHILYRLKIYELLLMNPSNQRRQRKSGIQENEEPSIDESKIKNKMSNKPL
jgi:hypothetical protein